MKKETYPTKSRLSRKAPIRPFFKPQKNVKTKERGKKGSGWPTLLLLCTYVKAVVPKTCQNKYRLTG